jgi:hypothetical protein
VKPCSFTSKIEKPSARAASVQLLELARARLGERVAEAAAPLPVLRVLADRREARQHLGAGLVHALRERPDAPGRELQQARARRVVEVVQVRLVGDDRLAVGEALEQAAHDRDAAAAGEARDEDVVAGRLELEPEVERLEGALLAERVELVDRTGQGREGGGVAAPAQLVGREAERLGIAQETARTARRKSLRPSGTLGESVARPGRMLPRELVAFDGA